MINDDAAYALAIADGWQMSFSVKTNHFWLAQTFPAIARATTRPLADEQDDCKQTRRAARRNAPGGTPPLRPSPDSSIPTRFRETARLPFNPGAPLRSGVRGSTFLVTSTLN